MVPDDVYAELVACGHAPALDPALSPDAVQDARLQAAMVYLERKGWAGKGIHSPTLGWVLVREVVNAAGTALPWRMALRLELRDEALSPAASTPAT